jgi:hypothetical protein
MQGLHYAIGRLLGRSLQQLHDYRLNMHTLLVSSRLQAPKKAQRMFQDTCVAYRMAKAEKALERLQR